MLSLAYSCLHPLTVGVRGLCLLRPFFKPHTMHGRKPQIRFTIECVVFGLQSVLFWLNSRLWFISALVFLPVWLQTSYLLLLLVLLKLEAICNMRSKVLALWKLLILILMRFMRYIIDGKALSLKCKSSVRCLGWWLGMTSLMIKWPL